MNVETYLAIALLNMGWDCAHCVNEKREYNIIPSLFISLLWPVVMIVIISLKTYRQYKENT